MSAQPLRTPPAQLRRTRCNCHPETCCCGEYTLYLNGERIVSGYRDNLQKVADAVNAAAALSQQPSLKPEARGGVDGVLDAVRKEIERATAKFPTWPTDPLHACGVVQEESGELAKAVLQAVYEPHKSTPEDVATEAFQTAAMAIRFLASMDRYDWKPGEQHEQGTALTESRNG